MRRTFLGFLLACVFLSGVVSWAYAMDVGSYEKIAKETIRQALSGSIGDIDSLIADQEKLVAMGVEGCRAYGKKNQKFTKMMNLVVENAEKMKAMTLEEIEEAWHEGGVLNRNGIDYDSIDHFSPALSYMDAVVHPATTYIALKEYKKTKKRELLDQVKDELSEVLEHLSHVE